MHAVQHTGLGQSLSGTAGAAFRHPRRRGGSCGRKMLRERRLYLVSHNGRSQPPFGIYLPVFMNPGFWRTSFSRPYMGKDLASRTGLGGFDASTLA